MARRQLNDYTRMVWGQAHYFASFTPVPAEDLFQEGILVWYNCNRLYRPSKGIKFGTYFYRALHNRFLDVVNKWKLIPLELEPEPEAHNNFMDALETVSKETQKIIQLAMDNPLEFCKDYRTNRNKIRRICQRNGMFHREIQTGFRELKAICI